MNYRITRRGAFSLTELVVVIGIIAVLFGLLLPAIQRVRGAADRLVCAQQLHQIGVALHHYHSDYHVFPPGCSFNQGRDPYPFMSWHARLLPYLERDQLWVQATEAF